MTLFDFGIEVEQPSPKMTYSVGSGKLLLCGNGGTATPGGVEGTSAANDGLACDGRAPHALADASDVVPVFRHVCGCVCVVRVVEV